MKAELLKLLTPSSPSLETTGVNHNAITSEDINVILAYSKLSESEYQLLIEKYVNDSNYPDNAFYKTVYDNTKIIFYKNKKKPYKTKFSPFLKLAILETFIEKCWICRGTGVLITLNSIHNCPHCENGTFIYTDKVRVKLLKIDKKIYNTYKKNYIDVLGYLKDIELSALNKINNI